MKVIWSRTCILNGCESSKTILVDINSHWINTVHEDIETKVKLVAVNQVRLMHVTLYNHVFYLAGRISVHDFLSCQILWVSGQEYPLALTACFRFDDKCFISLGSNLTCEFFEVLW